MSYHKKLTTGRLIETVRVLSELAAEGQAEINRRLHEASSPMPVFTGWRPRPSPQADGAEAPFVLETVH